MNNKEKEGEGNRKTAEENGGGDLCRGSQSGTKNRRKIGSGRDLDPGIRGTGGGGGEGEGLSYPRERPALGSGPDELDGFCDPASRTYERHPIVLVAEGEARLAPRDHPVRLRRKSAGERESLAARLKREPHEAHGGGRSVLDLDPLSCAVRSLWIRQPLRNSDHRITGNNSGQMRLLFTNS